MALTKANIIASVYGQLDLQKKKSTIGVETLFEIIKHTLESGEDVLISGFGKFCIRHKRKRRGRNPQTGEDFYLDSRSVVTFKCSSVLREKINKKGGVS